MSQIITQSRPNLLSDIVIQAAHGFALGANIYKEPVSGVWMLADSMNEATLCDGHVVEILDVDSFILGYTGVVHSPLHGLIRGEHYWLTTGGLDNNVRPLFGYAQITRIVLDINFYVLPARIAIEL